MTIQTRQQHLAWCKERALEYCDKGDLTNAWASMVSDLNKHPGTQGHSGVEIGTLLMFSGGLSTVPEMRKFIEGFN